MEIKGRVAKRSDLLCHHSMSVSSENLLMIFSLLNYVHLLNYGYDGIGPDGGGGGGDKE